MKKKKITIKDIAKILNISPSTVSKAFSNHPRISKETKKAVREVAQKLNYQPNHLASALRKGRTNLVGVIIPRTHSNFFSSVVQYMEEVLDENGYNIIITQSNESYQKECKNIDTLLYTQVDGILASMANETTDLSHYLKIKSKGVPLIMFDRGENDLGVDYIGINDYKSSHLVVEHLVAQQCKRIAHIAGYSHTRIYKNRIKGYKDALIKHNLPIKNDLIIESGLTLEDGREKMKQLLALPQRPDAVYVAGDYTALGALQVLQEKQIKVPQEIALVGFSNEPFTSLINPALSTVNQHSDQIGKLAAKTFLKRINDLDWTPSLNKIILEPELLIRASSNKGHYL